MERNRTEAERKRAEEQLAKAQEAERRAPQDAEKALYADRVWQAQQDRGPKLDRLAALQAEARGRFKKERQELMERGEKK